MKTKIFLLAIIALCSVVAFAQKKKDKNLDKVYKYEIVCNHGNQSVTKDHKTVKVFSYGKKADDARELCQENAVHGILFKGYQGAGADSGMRPLCPDGYESNKEYFDTFFANGYYRQYVTLTNNGAIAPGDMIKVDKKEYKIGMLVTVNVTELRRRLEKDGIIKSLNSIF
jgi:hypothetical protein